MVGLLPISEYDLLVREMTISGLDFKNPVGIETFNCFKKICVIERNTCESARTDPAPVETQSTGTKNLLNPLTKYKLRKMIILKLILKWEFMLSQPYIQELCGIRLRD